MQRTAPLIALSMLVACMPQNPRPALPECTVVEQPLSRLLSALTIIVPEELGGRECTPGPTESCATVQDQRCVGAMVVDLASMTTVRFRLDNRSAISIDVADVSVVGDCTDWSVAGSFATSIDSDATADVPVTFQAAELGLCAAELRIQANADNFPSTRIATVRLEAEVVSAD